MTSFAPLGPHLTGWGAEHLTPSASPILSDSGTLIPEQYVFSEALGSASGSHVGSTW